ncbi:MULTISPECIES: Tol-Pal system beta propeller repeat protein TolB [unclassified Thioalkalivibrio]|uniref:Tol-Pal system beta propeller repeat protein TolB n=1 Tax=unclassified Thioalkalivibrio TaxID=2621013 RepID=UPI00037E6495|nr:MULTISPECIES: Tol-Pal system beta propeller repeat protein TolB [unclassified Thioalkalivibrio]
MRRLIHWMLPAMLLLWAAQAQAVLEVTVTEGVTGAIPVAVAPFTYEGEGELDEDISQIVAANLARSGLFNVEQDDLPSAPSGPADFLAEPWADTGVEYLVVGNQRRDGDDVLVEFHVFDVLSEERLGGWRIPVPGDMLRRGAHRISDIIYEQITGDPGAFSARIAFVSVERNGDERRFALEVADSDGANPRTLFRSAKPIMSPDWSPDGRELVYVSFENRRSEVYRQNVETGSRERVASFTGINSAPAWSPDGRYLALSLSRDGAPNIYLMELETGEMRQMTQTSSIETEPVWSPDGETLYFTSDRAGAPQIYALPREGGSPRRLTFESGYAAAATVSPDGRYLVYVHGGDGGFQLARLDLNDRRVTRLTDGRDAESPSFAPNGSMIIYAMTDGGRGVLGSVSQDGQVHQRLAAREGEVREPAWSPLN